MWTPLTPNWSGWQFCAHSVFEIAKIFIGVSKIGIWPLPHIEEGATVLPFTSIPALGTTETLISAGVTSILGACIAYTWRKRI
jgi:hypothetical protein